MSHTVVFPDIRHQPQPGKTRWVNVYPNGNAVHYGFPRSSRNDAQFLKSSFQTVIYRLKITRKEIGK